MKHIIFLIVGTLLLCCQSSVKQRLNSETSGQITTENSLADQSIYNLHYEDIDKLKAAQIESNLNQGHKMIIEFFSRDFESNFDVYIFSTRDSLDAQWQRDWNMPNFKSQCWMVASGIAHRLDLLSPRVWETQACEHDNKDKLATQQLIIHELVHVFHGQNNPSPTFDSVENIDWFVEGIAVYASGQLDDERYARAKTSILNEESPSQLADIWKGEHRYGFAGSIVKFIDDNYGREVLVQLIVLTNDKDVLSELKISEEDLIQQWKESFN